MRKYVERLTIDSSFLWQKLDKIKRRERTIGSFHLKFIPVHFRCRSYEQLYSGFHFSEFMLMLVGLFRLAYPNWTIARAWHENFGLYQHKVRDCFNLFLQWMLTNWGTYYMGKPYLADMATAIQLKLRSLNCLFNPPETPGGFAVLGSLKEQKPTSHHTLTSPKTEIYRG